MWAKNLLQKKNSTCLPNHSAIHYQLSFTFQFLYCRVVYSKHLHTSVGNCTWFHDILEERKYCKKQVFHQRLSFTSHLPSLHFSAFNGFMWQVLLLNILYKLSLLLTYQAPSPASHEWKSAEKIKRLCQVCHLVVDGKGVSCKTCGLRAHSACGSNYSETNATATDSNLRNRTLTGGSDRNKDPQGSLFYRHFEPRIKKILHHQHLPSIESGGSEERGSGASSSARFSSCGDSVAASTAIVVVSILEILKQPEVLVQSTNCIVQYPVDIRFLLKSCKILFVYSNLLQVLNQSSS